ncbi:uncharacterized protein LOC111454354 isoform X1 [Cucurbita moschata]|uniref:Uncharacterized protein LOC111454354 isoform X1 n=1 Tax=Cucurbita moschata TaxID=3662 RepID=A0A6J1GJ81_CUCMO|nr:uncharacterized protein LOC111454354 isoform X1 [Cucurbita moschata]XP_022951580.1 uncharacterized protein LOC111454354 isoform X1 [Cucurbita moschata]
MSSPLCSSIRALAPQCWRRTNLRFFILLQSKRCVGFAPRFVACLSSNDDSVAIPKPVPLAFDPVEEMYGLGVDLKPRNSNSSAPEPRSWFGPNGQYIRELPCPSCRGRGYAPCTECGIERSRADCSVCNGKGIVTCHQCLGDRVIWEESIDERPWEKARSTSPLRMKEDDEVDNLEIKLEEKKKSKRVYQSPPPEVGLKISRSLKSLNAKTGLFSKRMKIIHRDPTLHAQRVAAIKKAKGSAEARKRTSEALKAFFSDPKNRQKRSIAMKGIKFYCKNCGREGHRRHYCPELKGDSIDRRFRCRVCGEKGHNRRTCKKSRLNGKPMSATIQCHCTICGGKGHSSRNCSKSEMRNSNKGIHYPQHQNPGNVLSLNLIKGDRMTNESSRVRQYRCRICEENGHNRQNCPNIDTKVNHTTRRRTYSCKLCHEKGHNSRTCPVIKMNNL